MSGAEFLFFGKLKVWLFSPSTDGLDPMVPLRTTSLLTLWLQMSVTSTKYFRRTPTPS